MDFFPWNDVFWAVFAIAAFCAFKPVRNRPFAEPSSQLRFWIVKVAQFWLMFQGVYGVIAVLHGGSLHGERDIGSLVLSAFNLIAWAYFFFRDLASSIKGLRAEHRI